MATKKRIPEPRAQEARETREDAAVEYGIKPEDKKMYGTTDWYIVRNARGTLKQMRQRDITTEEKLAGPYFTKDQARCETSQFKGDR